jgi:hypothetical protein
MGFFLRVTQLKERKEWRGVLKADEPFHLVIKKGDWSSFCHITCTSSSIGYKTGFEPPYMCRRSRPNCICLSQGRVRHSADVTNSWSLRPQSFIIALNWQCGRKIRKVFILDTKTCSWTLLLSSISRLPPSGFLRLILILFPHWGHAVV